MMDKEQIIALAEKAKLFVVRNGDCDVEDLLRFLEAYKAELLKEAGEPVAEYKTYTGNGELYAPFNQVILNSWVTPPIGTKFFTSDQLAAAILKATGTLEEEVERLKAELAKYRDAPVVAWSHLVKGLTFVETYAGSKPLIVKPGEEK